MNLKLIFSAALIAGSSLLSMAQTHQEGVEYYRADQFKNAKELLQRNYNNAGTDKAVSEYYLGLIALQDKNTSEAKSHFEKGLSINPDYAFNYVGLGQIALMNGDKKGAETYFKDAKSHSGKEKDEKASLDIAIARAYYEVDPVTYAKEIDKNVQQAVKDSPKDGPAYTNTDIYLFEGDRKKDLAYASGGDNQIIGQAANQYESASRYNPNATEAYVKYAELFTQVNPQYAINMLNNLLSVNPNSALGQRELAEAYYNANKYKEAADQYRKYVQNPNHFKQDEDRLSFLLFVDGNYKEGYDFASQLLKENPDNFTARRFQFMNAAQIQEMESQLLPMAEALLASHKANPANIFAPIDYNLISEELLNAGKAEEAQALLEEAISKEPDNADYYARLASVFVKEKDWVKTSEAYDQYIAKKENPGYNDKVQQARYKYYAGASQLIDNPTLAAQLLNQVNTLTDEALAISADYPTPYILKGRTAVALASSDQERNSVGTPYYTQALQIIEASADPSRYASDSKELYNYVGNYYLDQKDPATALIYFNKALELDPNNESYRKFVEGIKK